MKPTKIPTLIVRDAFSSPTISIKFNRLKLYMKSVVIGVVVSLCLAGGFLLNVQHEQQIILKQKIQLELDKSTNLQPGIVIDATADIIRRDGHLSLDVAKKYAMWIFEAGIKYHVDPITILSVIAIESSFDYKIISPTGPIGLMQVASSFHKEKTTQIALFDPKNNINVGTQILKEYSDKSRTETETLLRYNGSLGSAPLYAYKVLNKKNKYENEIMNAVVNAI